MACGTVDLSWFLTLGSLICFGVWAERMEQAPMAAGDAKVALMAEKSNGLSIIAFLVAEVLPRTVMIRTVASSTPPGTECLGAGWERHLLRLLRPGPAWSRK
eukprot:2654551-Pyramimonas_sp.AAC.1